jgi:hypothetical protein
MKILKIHKRLIGVFSIYDVKSRMFNAILLSDNLQGDREVVFVLIAFWRALKIQINHDFEIPLFDKRLIKN